MGRQQFLLDATDRQHLALQRDLAGHAQLLAHRTSAQQTGQRSDHGDARRRAILWHCTRGHVHVELLALEHRGVNAQIVSVRPHVRQRNLYRLLHHFAELTRERETLIARHARGFDKQHVATRAGHR